MLPVFHHGNAVHENMGDPDRITVRQLECRRVSDCSGIENDEVSCVFLTDQSAIRKAEVLRRE